MNPTKNAANHSAEQIIDLRAHHLYTLASLESLKAHKSKLREKLARRLKSGKLRFLGYGSGKKFADHLVDTLLAILNNEIKSVRITAARDEICKQCAKKRENYCKVGGVKWSKNFLQMVDEALVKNTNGLLQIGQSYLPEYLLKNLGAIRKAIRKTLLEIPGLWMKDKKIKSY